MRRAFDRMCRKKSISENAIKNEKYRKGVLARQDIILVVVGGGVSLFYCLVDE